MRIGAHQSIAGGVSRAFERAQADGAEALQIFTKSGRQWAAKPLDEAEVAAFRAAHRSSQLPVVAHASYLINLGADPGPVRERSVEALVEELERCERLGIEWLVLHPGAHADERTGIDLVARALEEALARTAGFQAGIALELTAGQGQGLGHTFAQLAAMLAGAGDVERLATCLDTCHLFASGHDIATPEGWQQTLDDFDRIVGVKRLRALHLNDSVKGLGCRVDRHARLGEGTLGVAAFEAVVRDPRLKGLPAVLETPEGKWKEEIALLKRLRDGHREQRDAREKASGSPKTGSLASRRVDPHSKRNPRSATSAAPGTHRQGTSRS